MHSETGSYGHRFVVKSTKSGIKAYFFILAVPFNGSENSSSS